MIGDRKKISELPHPHLLQAQYALALPLSKLTGRPGTEWYHRPTQLA